MNYQWKILEVFAKDEVITGAKYHITGSDEEFSVETEGYYHFVNPSLVIPFNEITEEMVADWIDKEAMRDGKNHIKLALENQIQALKEQNTTIAPWMPQIYTPIL
jgi:hypothetical protein